MHKYKVEEICVRKKMIKKFLYCIFFIFVVSVIASFFILKFLKKSKAYKVGLIETVLKDSIRNRELKIAIWYPTNDNEKIEQIEDTIWQINQVAKNGPLRFSKFKYPLILFSHGYGGDRWNNSWTAQLLASKGYIIVTIDHYGNTWYNMLSKWSIQPYERANDISFIINELFKNPKWSQKIDKNKIGMAGFSQGGMAGLWLAGARSNIKDLEKEFNQLSENNKQKLLNEFKDKDMYLNSLDKFDYDYANSSFKDSRIKAVFAMAPGIKSETNYFDANGFRDINIPVYIVAGACDEIINPINNAIFFAKNIKNSQITILPNATHWVFLNEGNDLGHKTRPDLTLDKPCINRKLIHNQVGQMALKFFNENLK